ncbi:putative membrane protein [Desulfosporosinus sp. OT]|nr:putative membrane protein [Desulfosporosinus sp. OT]
MNIKEKGFFVSITAIALLFGILPVANAMHIMEGYLPVGYCIAWGAICVPFLVIGYLSIKKQSLRIANPLLCLPWQVPLFSYFHL